MKFLHIIVKQTVYMETTLKQSIAADQGEDTVQHVRAKFLGI